MDDTHYPDQKAIRQAMAFANSPQGQKLIASLQKSNDPTIQQAFSSGGQGDRKQMEKLMQALLSSPQIQQIINSMGENHG